VVTGLFTPQREHSRVWSGLVSSPSSSGRLRDAPGATRLLPSLRPTLTPAPAAPRQDSPRGATRCPELPFSLVKKPGIIFGSKDRRPLPSPRRPLSALPQSPPQPSLPSRRRLPPAVGGAPQTPAPGPPRGCPGTGRCPQGPASPHLPRRRAGRRRVAPRCQGAITPTPSSLRRPPCEHGHL